MKASKKPFELRPNNTLISEVDCETQMMETNKSHMPSPRESSMVQRGTVKDFFLYN